jgi:hypothetical protein
VSIDGPAQPEGAGSTHKCPTPVRLYHSGTARRLLLPCGSRRCTWCGPNIWKRRVLAGLHAGLRSAPPDEYLAVLLTARGDVDAEDWNSRSQAAWHRFFTYLREEYPGARLDFWKVAELQERGHVHFHFVLRGLRFLPVARLRRLAKRAGFGPWVGVRRPKDYPGGVRSLGWYFTKYLLKDYGRVVAGLTKLVTFSNGWRSGWKRRVSQAAKGTWLFAGPVGMGWQMVAVSDAPADRVYGPRWVPWWGPRSWQAARAAEHETAPLPWGAVPAPVRG